MTEPRVEVAAITRNRMEDERLIRALVEDWVVCRDSGLWDKLVGLWHSDAQMCTTWFRGPAAAFVEATRRGFDNGLDVLHTLGGTTVEVRGRRAVANTRMTISQRAQLDGTTVDVTCIGRFYDFLLAPDSDGMAADQPWRLVRRQPVYERDRMDPVVVGTAIALDPAVMGRFPDGYRHLAYLHNSQGFEVSTDLPVRRGAALNRLYDQGESWLAGEEVSYILT